MLALRVAFANLVGAGLRTWLNVLALSFSYVVIIFYNGLIEGWNQQARRETIAWEVGAGQYWQESYDPYDPFTLVDAHAPLPPALARGATSGSLSPVLIVQGTIYPGGRMQSALLRGIDPDQGVVALPTAVLDTACEGGALPVLIGRRMAESAGLALHDIVLVRWRDRNGAFDACEALVADIFDVDVPSVDVGQIWVPLERLRSMTGLAGEATLVTAAPDAAAQPAAAPAGWHFKTTDMLLQDLTDIIEAKRIGSAVMYSILLLMALLALFDTQVLSIFRRQREIGTYVALGMTRWQVVGLFTFEGGAHSILAAFAGAIYGVPLLWYLATVGFGGGGSFENSGLAGAARIYPAFSAGLVGATIVLIFIAATIVSFLPARRIAHMQPTDALRGRMR